MRKPQHNGRGFRGKEYLDAWQRFHSPPAEPQAATAKPAPPYARRAETKPRRTWNATRIYTGPGAFQTANEQDALGWPVAALPPGKDPAGFDWRPMIALNHSPLVVDTGETTANLAALLKALALAGAELVAIVRNDPENPGECYRFRGRNPLDTEGGRPHG